MKNISGIRVKKKLVVVSSDLPTEEEKKLEWILMTPFQETGICTHSVLTSTTDHSKALIIEIGPR